MSATNINYNGLGMMIFRAGVGFGFGLPSDEHLVSYWPFNETSGTNAPDLSGNGNDGTLVNMEDADWVDGVVGKCLDFDGTDEYVDCESALIPATEDFTIVGWIKTSAIDDLQAMLGQYNRGSAGRMILYGSLVTYLDHARLFISGANPSTTVLESLTATNDGLWHQIAVTRDGTTFKMYIDGILEDESTTTATILIGFNTKIGSSDGSRHMFDGLIDEVRIYSTALTASEIKALYDYPGGKG